MHIKKWLKLNAIRPSHFAKTAGVAVGTMHNILKGSNPSLSTIRKIAKATKGDVGPNDWNEK